MKRNPLNKESVTQVVRLFDYAFKKGVVDACELDDEHTSRAFIERYDKEEVFGLLGDDITCTWHQWRYIVFRWCRYRGVTSLGEKYIDRLRTKNFLWVILPMTFRFYLLGISEYLAYPAPLRIEIFKNKTFVRWRPTERGVYGLRKSDIINYVQEFTYQRRQWSEERKLLEGVSDAVYDNFCELLWALSQPIKEILTEDLLYEDGYNT